MSRQIIGASIVALAAVILGLHSLNAQEPAPKPIDDPEAYAVYASLLPHEWTVRVARAKRLVFQPDMDPIRILRNAIVAAWVLVGPVAIGGNLFLCSLLFCTNPTPWNFPGERPLFDVAAFNCGIVALFNVSAWLLARPIGLPSSFCASLLNTERDAAIIW